MTIQALVRALQGENTSVKDQAASLIDSVSRKVSIHGTRTRQVSAATGVGQVWAQTLQ